MSYVDPDVGESFIFRIRKALVNSPQVKWFNTYEARFTAAGTQADLDSLGDGLVAFEAALLLNTGVIDQLTISTWAEDSHPYNPESFVTIPQEVTGQRTIGTQQSLDLRIAWFLKRQVNSGRIGRIFLRNSLVEEDVQSFAGTYALSDPATRAGALDEAIDGAGLGTNFSGGLAQPKLALIGDGQVTREITNITSGGVAVIKLNHKYFDRA